MSDRILRANFTISSSAKNAIERLRREWNAQFPDPAAVLTVGWGLFNLNSGEKFENVVVSFYGESDLPEVAHGIQNVSGLDLIFFTTAEYHQKFEGKVLDYSEEKKFVLAGPPKA